MPFKKAVFLDVSSMGKGLDLSGLQPFADSWSNYNTSEPAEVLERIINADLVLSNKVMLDRDTLSQCKQLKLICVTATGTNNVDIEAARELGIAVTNVTGYGTPSVVQHVFSLLLSLTSRLTEHQQAAKDGRWQNSPQFCILDFPFNELNGKTMGIVGYGELGKGVAKVAKAFGMKVIIAQRSGSTKHDAERIPLDELLAQADVVSLHVPLAENTRNLIAEKQFSIMKNHAILLNMARGGIVDEQALANALQTGEIGGAGIDVLIEEPPVNGNLLLSLNLPNLIITPHIAWAAVESRQRLINIVTDNIKAYSSGKQQNRVD